MAELIDMIIGLSTDDFQTVFKHLQSRTVKKDGKNYIITRDYNPERINLEIENNIITKAYYG